MRSLRVPILLLTLALVGALAPVSTAHAAANAVGTYTPLKSARLLDTRPGSPLAAGKSLTLTVAGKGGVPTTGVSAVVVNLTATGATSGGFMTAYPTGGTRSNVSSINFLTGVSRANIATVPLGTGTSAGKISVYNSAGSVDVVVDVVGYYANTASTATLGSEFDVPDPERLADTRGDSEGQLAPQESLDIRLDFNPDANKTVTAVAVNVTAVGAKSSGYLTAYDGGTLPGTSTLNFVNGNATPNLAVVKTGHCTSADCSAAEKLKVAFSVYNGSKAGVDVIVDLVGIYYKDGTVGLRFYPNAPRRISDSRTGLNGKPATAGQTQTLKAPTSVANANTVAVVANTTAISPTGTTYLTLWRAGTSRPGVSNLNTTKGLTVANGTLIPMSATNTFNLYNSTGTTNFAIDVTGRFEPGSGFVSAAQRSASARPDFGSPSVSTERGAVSR